MMEKGKRLTCPLCRDSGWFTVEQLASVRGRVFCSNHTAWVLMVDLAELMEIFGSGVELHEEWEEETA